MFLFEQKNIEKFFKILDNNSNVQYFLDRFVIKYFSNKSFRIYYLDEYFTYIIIEKLTYKNFFLTLYYRESHLPHKIQETYIFKRDLRNIVGKMYNNQNKFNKIAKFYHIKLKNYRVSINYYNWDNPIKKRKIIKAYSQSNIEEQIRKEKRENNLDVINFKILKK